MLKPTSLALITLLLAGCDNNQNQTSKVDAKLIQYPLSKTVEQTDNYHGIAVSDPYRWLEDIDSADTREWIEAQNKVASEYLDAIPGRQAISARLTELWNFERFGKPDKRGDMYFYSRNDGLQNQSPIYVQKGISGEPRLLLDPNALASDGTMALNQTQISDDGRYMAYSVSSGGSDWQTWYIRDVATGKDLADKIEWSKFSDASWLPDNSGFYYSGYDQPIGENALKAVNKYQKLFFHKIGTPQSQDRVAYERKDQADWGFGGEVSNDGRFLVISISMGTDERNRVFYQDLQNPNSPVIELIGELEAAYEFIDSIGQHMFFRTDLDAPQYRVISIDTQSPKKSNWKTVVEQSNATLVGANILNQQFLVSYLRDAKSEVSVFDLSGKKIREVELPSEGTAIGFEGSRFDTETFYNFVSFNAPGTIYHFDAKSGESKIFRAPKLGFEPNDFETRQVFYSSKDGSKIPLFISAKKGLKLNGKNPTILYGYGGFNIPVTPNFKVENLVFMEMGGVYASANLRGGGEYGGPWHEAGMKTKKQNVFDDFIAAAEYLIAQKYTSNNHLAISGRSNGGLLVGASELQRPDLFAAALPAVGVLDMLRFRDFTIGWAWESDYGSVLNKEEFDAIYAYSPLHNIKSGVNYPPTLVLTGDHDDRVYPAHSFKFTAALQNKGTSKNPQLIRIDTRAGHGSGKPTSMLIAEATDALSFVGVNTGMLK